MNAEKRNTWLISAGLLVLLASAALYLDQRDPAAITPSAIQDSRSRKEASAEPTHGRREQGSGSYVGFASREKLVRHYKKHGAEFGSISLEQYLREAQALRDRPKESSMVEHIRRNGTVTRFDLKTGAFLAFNPNGTIRTYFKPNDGIAYFHRQTQRDQE